ncbi:hypothetical protein QMZ92_16225 [Streptomyces sp. HNM0645]|uniref:hypothetical protein n=1 Tax=Streptomyces sp. HNM0645 TaxID=2782343 RepID=UPI0024B6DD7E|nr:hypothetical protein [Streptomyces sp. HNM0645]MDI9885881.1 hypothetical protein [Streptomyces sp. HNM0645]
MPEDRATSTKNPDGRPLERALRAHADAGQLALLAAYRAFIAHTEACQPCRATNVDCDEAASLRQAYRTAKAATP